MRHLTLGSPSGGYSGQVGERPRNMKSMWPLLAAKFLWLIFAGPGWPRGPSGSVAVCPPLPSIFMTTFTIWAASPSMLVWIRFISLQHHYYHPLTKLREGNVFTPVCHSLRRVCMWWVWEYTPRPEANTHPLLPPVADSKIHWSGHYASYWNAFLLLLKI